jgi:hypothetical protein
MKPLKPQEVTQPGAYEWVTPNGERHIGFIYADRRGALMGSFVAEAGATRALRPTYDDGSPCEGMFYGPLPLAPNR